MTRYAPTQVSSTLTMSSFACEFSPPTSTISVTGHHEEGGHTLYDIEGCVRVPVSSVASDARAWRAAKRLAELRELHDRVERALGRARYVELFKGTPFASRGG